MSKRLMLGVALSALMVSGAFAQTPNSTPAPGATPPAASSSQSSGTSGKPEFVSAQKPDQWLSSNFKGTDVVGADGKKIGDVSDVLFDKHGKIEAYVVSVGGFLGMGAKSVALAPSSFEVVPGSQGAADQLKLSASLDELKQAQNFEPYQPPRPVTTGSGSSSGLGSPAGRPSTNSPPTGR